MGGQRRGVATEQKTLGGSVSLTATEKPQPDVLPAASSTAQPTGVAPWGKTEPEGGAHAEAPRPGQLSLTAGAA